MYYFSYGSNNWHQMCTRVGKEVAKPVAATISGYKLEYRGESPNWPGSASATAVKGKGVVHGSLYHLTDEELKLLWRFEKRYKLERVKAFVPGLDREVPAEMFVLKKQEAIGKPSRDYLQAVKTNLAMVGWIQS